MSLTKKERSQKVLKEDAPGFFMEARFREKTGTLFIGSGVRALNISLKIGMDALFINYELAVNGDAADKIFQRMVAQPQEIELFLASQFLLMLQRSLQTSLALEPLQKFLAKFKTKEIFSFSNETDRSIVLFQKSLESIDRVLDSNRSRFGVFSESFTWFFFISF